MNAESRPSEPITTPIKPSPLNFEPFAQQPEYVQTNRDLIQIAISYLREGFVNIVDVACGTGLAPKLLIEELQRTGQKGRIIGIDPNPTSLEIARKTTHPSEDVSVEFIKGFGQVLRELLQGKIPKDGVDGVSILDAIHEIPGEEDKKKVLSSMADILKPGGVLLLNSAFTTFGMEPSPMAWGKWKLRAFRHFDGKQNKDINAIKLHTPEEYKQMLEASKLKVISQAKKVVNLSHEALVAISHYPEFINGVFRDMIDQDKFSLEEKRDALVKALEGIRFLPRGWWEIIAQKPAGQKPVLQTASSA